jgi:hypothetical protein
MPCKHSDDMEPEWCIKCLGKDDAETPIRTATYKAVCKICQQAIVPGDKIIMRNLRWVHRNCR